MMKTGSEDQGAKITRDIAPMLAALRACRGLPLDDPRVVAALADKRRLVAEVEAARDGWASPA